MNLNDDSTPELQNTVLTVTALNRLVRRTVERAVPLTWVGGEVSNLVRAASGHLYFSLKDESAQVRCVMFRSRAQGLAWQLQNGQHVEVRALASLYEPRGEFQLTVEDVRRAGLGRLFEAFLRLKEKLEGEGLLDVQRKRPLPSFPQRLAIVTSLQAAALQDVITTLKRRAPMLELAIFPAPVQGDGAAAQLANAVGAAGRPGCASVVLLCRGGGSMEDLWAFNDETLARAVAASPIPVVTGIGHETDLTIADLVADLRAPTPTAGAELISHQWFAAQGAVSALAASMQASMAARVEAMAQQVDRMSSRLVHPLKRVEGQQQGLAVLAARLKAARAHRLGEASSNVQAIALRLLRRQPALEPLKVQVSALAARRQSAMGQWRQEQRQELSHLSDALAHLDPTGVLRRGYAIVLDHCGRPVARASALALGESVRLRLGQGEADATIDKISAQG